MSVAAAVNQNAPMNDEPYPLKSGVRVIERALYLTANRRHKTARKLSRPSSVCQAVVLLAGSQRGPEGQKRIEDHCCCLTKCK